MARRRDENHVMDTNKGCRHGHKYVPLSKTHTDGSIVDTNRRNMCHLHGNKQGLPTWTQIYSINKDTYRWCRFGQKPVSPSWPQICAFTKDTHRRCHRRHKQKLPSSCMQTCTAVVDTMMWLHREYTQMLPLWASTLNKFCCCRQKNVPGATLKRASSDDKYRVYSH